MSTEAYSTIHGSIFEVPLMSTPTLVSKCPSVALSCLLDPPLNDLRCSLKIITG